MYDAFREMHFGPRMLVLPNAWDAGSAKIIAAAGFPAIASTSAGVAFAQGYADGERIGRAEMLEQVRRMVAAVDVPVTADMEAGYGPAPEDVAETARGVIAVGAVGMNLEDGTPAGEAPLMDFARAVERVRAARQAAEEAGAPIVINARTDGYLRGLERTPALLADTIKRANAFREAGADCLFVPAVDDAATIKTLVAEIDGPLNILAGPKSLPLPELESLGVARVSIGSTLARAALTLVRDAARELLGPGTYGFCRGAIAHPEMNRLMGR